MANMELITSVTVGSGGAASVTLPATGTIPATYTDLKIVTSVRTTRGSVGSYFYISFNGSASNFSSRFLGGDGASASSGSVAQLAGIETDANATASTFNNTEIYIPNYTSSNAKSYSVDSASENNATTGFDYLVAGLWNPAVQGAITTITLTPESGGNFVQDSTFYLYGISNVTSSPKATGGIVSQDATYWYHTFPFSSTFTPTSALTNVDYLVIAGGGGGGSYGGGGGAGGLRSTVTATGGGGSLESKISLNSGTAYTITVGAGGTGTSTYGATDGSNGGNSSIAGSGLTTITSTGGGKGAGGNEAGLSGGSGGGAGLYVQTGGSGTSGQGYAGGLADQGSSGGYGGGGGGGAGAAGTNCIDSSTRGNGGAGVSIPAMANATFTGVNTYYAGGAGGGAENYGVGGAGGGANGITDANGFSGTLNTGGGGGGAGQAYAGGNGGSGLVIVRYAK